MAKSKTELTASVKLPLKKDALCVKYSPTKDIIISGHTDGIIRIFQSCTGKVLGTLVRSDMVEEIPVTSVNFKPISNRSDYSTVLASYADGKVKLWDHKTGAVIKELNENRQTLGALYHPKLAKFITLGDNASINLYDEETLKLEHTYEKGALSSVVDGHSSRVFAAVFHPQQTTEFVTGGWDSVVHFWDMRQSNSLRYIKGVHMCGEGLDISRSGRELMTCSYARDNALQLWHYHTGRLLTNIEPDLHKPMLYCGQWMTPEMVVIGGTDPNILRIVSLKTLTTMMTYRGTSSGVYSLDHCLKSSRMAKKDTSFDVKLVFCVDKSLIETDVTI